MAMPFADGSLRGRDGRLRVRNLPDVRGRAGRAAARHQPAEGGSCASRSRSPGRGRSAPSTRVWFDRGVPALGRLFDRGGAYSLPARERAPLPAGPTSWARCSRRPVSWPCATACSPAASSRCTWARCRGRERHREPCSALGGDARARFHRATSSSGSRPRPVDLRRRSRRCERDAGRGRKAPAPAARVPERRRCGHATRPALVAAACGGRARAHGDARARRRARRGAAAARPPDGVGRARPAVAAARPATTSSRAPSPSSRRSATRSRSRARPRPRSTSRAARRCRRRRRAVPRRRSRPTSSAAASRPDGCSRPPAPSAACSAGSTAPAWRRSTASGSSSASRSSSPTTCSTATATPQPHRQGARHGPARRHRHAAAAARRGPRAARGGRAARAGAARQRARAARARARLRGARRRRAPAAQAHARRGRSTPSTVSRDRCDAGALAAIVQRAVERDSWITERPAWRRPHRVSSALIEPVREKVLAGERLDFDDGVALLECDDLLALGELADTARRLRGGGDEVYFVNNLYLNHTNVCRVKCKFCAFARTTQAGRRLHLGHRGADAARGRRLRAEPLQRDPHGRRREPLPRLRLLHRPRAQPAGRAAADVHAQVLHGLGDPPHDEALGADPRRGAARAARRRPRARSRAAAPRSSPTACASIVAPGKEHPDIWLHVHREAHAHGHPDALHDALQPRRDLRGARRPPAAAARRCRTTPAGSWPSSRCRSTPRTRSSSGAAGSSRPATTTSRCRPSRA